MKLVKSYKQLVEIENLNKKFKNSLKAFLINRIFPNKFDEQNEYIIYPFWHHVFEDEIKNFKFQLDLMKNYGDFISYEDSIKILKEGSKPKDKYFCLSFDDGFKNIYENVVDIFLKDNIPCMFFIPTSFIGNLRDDAGKIFFNSNEINNEFLSWNDCEKIVSEKIFDIGSHSINHNLISKLTNEECTFEVGMSKNIIENKLKIKCNHFAPPVGDYSINRDLEIIKNYQYKSLSTTIRGKMGKNNSDVFALRRHHLMANLISNFLKYFFSK